MKRYRTPRQNGWQILQHVKDPGARFLTTWRLCLKADQEANLFKLDALEAVLVLLSGRVLATVTNRQTQAVILQGELARGDRLMDADHCALYVPPQHVLRLTGLTDDIEAILVTTAVEGGGRGCFYATPVTRTRGQGWFTTRVVRDLFVDDAAAQRLMVGETFSAGWSSWPPHKHDGAPGALEEIYYFRMKGKATQFWYTDDGAEQAVNVQDGDLILVPSGYHPVVAWPDCDLYYLWALGGDQRTIASVVDPRYS